MNEATQFLSERGTLILFGVVLVEQAGLPLPAAPWLLAAGALAAVGKLNLAAAIAATMLACLIADSVWFYIGRCNSQRVWQWLSRMPLGLTPDGQRREEFLAHHAAGALLGAKFLGWLGNMIPPLAGTTGMSYHRFLVFDGLGSLLYSSCNIALGFVFSERLHQGVAWLRRLGVGASALLLTLMAGYVVLGVLQWRRNRPERQAKGAPVWLAKLLGWQHSALVLVGENKPSL